MSDRGSELSHLQIPEILEHNGSIVVKPIEGTPNE